MYVADVVLARHTQLSLARSKQVRISHGVRGAPVREPHEQPSRNALVTIRWQRRHEQFAVQNLETIPVVGQSLEISRRPDRVRRTGMRRGALARYGYTVSSATRCAQVVNIGHG